MKKKEKLSFNKILVTGGNGYVGSRLVLALRKRGYQVEVFDKPRNILKKTNLESAVRGKDAVFHLAALAELSYTALHPEETFRVNIQGTKNICKLCAKHNVVLNFISTCCIYGEPLENPSKESGPINPTDTYAFSKAAAENIVKMWSLAKGLKYNILRLGTVYGPSAKKEMRGDMCIQRFLKAAIQGAPLVIKGDGSQARNFIHINDAVRAFLKVAEKRINGETINIAGKEIITIKEIAKMAMEMSGRKKLVYGPAREHDFKHQDVSLEKAKKNLGWEPKIRFFDGLKDFYRWMKTKY